MTIRIKHMFFTIIVFGLHFQILFFSLALHPRKQIIVTTSDDHLWKMWAIPSGDIIMTGEGHTDWVSDCDFHPRYNFTFFFRPPVPLIATVIASSFTETYWSEDNEKILRTSSQATIFRQPHTVEVLHFPFNADVKK